MSSSTVTAIGLSLVYNVLTIVGVVAFGWPPGNVFVLFWAENVVLGLVTVIKVASAHGPGGSRAALAMFFCFHYGIFCLVHAAFTGLLAYRIGVELSFGLFGLPLIVIFIRYLVETVTVWFGPGRQRMRTSPKQAMIQPYPRIVILQVAVILAFFLQLHGLTGRFGTDDAPDPFTKIVIAVGSALRPLAAGISPRLLAPGVGYVALLMVIKTVVDVFTTARAARQ